MPKYPIILIACAVVLSSCSGPIETRVQSSSMATLPAQTSFTFQKKPEQASDIYREALALVSSELIKKGLAENDKAETLIQVSVSERPASIGITAGENDGTSTIAPPKSRKPLQSCQDREHRFSITMVAQPSGDEIYKGTAAEFHCKGRMEASLPHLVRAALSDFGLSSDGVPRVKTVRRSGRD